TDLITFEQFASGPGPGQLHVPEIPGSMAIAPTVSLSSSPPEFGGLSIGSPGSRAAFSTGADRDWVGISSGFNTTPGGQVFLIMDTPQIGAGGPYGGYWLYTFSSPISAFGTYITGWLSNSENSLYFEFNDGSSQ